MQPIRWTILGLARVMSATPLGCARWVELAPPSASPHKSFSRSISSDARVPLVMDTFRLSQNGASLNPSSEMERRILNSVQETRLFSALVPLGRDIASLGDHVVMARISIDEAIDPHSGQSAWKGFVVGASMFLLSPIIELHYDYAAKASLELERWDGYAKSYEAHSSGRLHYNLFGATPIMIDELKGQVTEACLAELIDQLVRDSNLYLAASAPLADSSIRTVTVKAKKFMILQPTSAITPISTAPVP